MAVARRARADWQKQERQREILLAAEALFIGAGGQLPSVAAVAARAGLAKGTVYLYFKTKQEVFLALLNWRLGEWLDAVTAVLEASDKPISVDRLVAGTADYLLEHPDTLRLASYGHSVLEQNIEAETVIGYKLAMVERLAELGAKTEACMPVLAPGQASRLYLQSYAYAVGLWQMADPPEAVKALLQRDDLAMFRVDFETELKAGLTALWNAA